MADLYRAKAEVTVYFYRDQDEPSLEDDAATWASPAGAMARIKFTDLSQIADDHNVPNDDLHLEIQGNDKDGDPETVETFLKARRAERLAAEGRAS